MAVDLAVGCAAGLVDIGVVRPHSVAPLSNQDDKSSRVLPGATLPCSAKESMLGEHTYPWRLTMGYIVCELEKTQPHICCPT
jgi:hypothetical protein